jgi:hypothetical protein
MADGGFTVLKPGEFIQKHPRIVQAGILLLKAGIKLGAAQLAITIPAETTEALGAVTDRLLGETLGFTLDCTAPEETSEVEEFFGERDQRQSIGESVDGVFKGAALMQPAELLSALSKSGKYKEATRQEYGLLKSWLDSQHPGWKERCGLHPTVRGGGVVWLPKDGGG